MAFEAKGRLSMDPRGVEQGLSQGQRKIKAWASETAKSLRNTLGSAFAVGSLVAGGRALINAGADVAAFAKQLRVTTDQMQVLEFAAAKNNVTMDDFRGVMNKLATVQADVENGNAQMIAQLEKIGIQWQHLRGASPWQMLEMIGQAARDGSINMGNMGTAIKVLGEQGSKILPTLEEGLSKIRQEAEAAGAILDRTDIAELEAADASIQLAKLSTRRAAGALSGFVANLADASVLGLDILRGDPVRTAYGRFEKRIQARQLRGIELEGQIELEKMLQKLENQNRLTEELRNIVRDNPGSFQ